MDSTARDQEELFWIGQKCFIDRSEVLKTGRDPERPVWVGQPGLDWPFSVPGCFEYSCIELSRIQLYKALRMDGSAGPLSVPGGAGKDAREKRTHSTHANTPRARARSHT